MADSVLHPFYVSDGLTFPDLPDCPVDEAEEFDLLFDSGLDEPREKSVPVLSDTDLAIFDPCAKEGWGICTVWLFQI